MTRSTAHDNRNAGFVLVTSLLVLLLLASLGAGAYFLTNINLRIAENTRSSTMAQYNAHEGLDIALIALGREFYERGDGTWPSLAQLRARMPAGSEFEILALDFDPANAEGLQEFGVITVRGFGPRGARYETGARFKGETTPIPIDPEADPLFGTGWVTDSKIEINGKTEFLIPLWAGQSLEASATRVLASAGQFAHSGFIGPSPATCKIQAQHSAVKCTSGQEPPKVPRFDFDERLAAMTADSAACSQVIGSSTTINGNSPHYRNATICLAEGVTVTLTGTASGLTVLGPRSAHLIIDGGSQPFGGEPDGIGIRAAVGTISFGSSRSYTLSGTNTLFMASGINVSKLIANQLAGGVVATLIGTERNVKIDGGGNDQDGTLGATIWADGHVCKQGNGGLNFIGSMLVGGHGSPDGGPCQAGIYWNGGGGGWFAGVSNVDIPGADEDNENQYAASGIRILARRP